MQSKYLTFLSPCFPATIEYSVGATARRAAVPDNGRGLGRVDKMSLRPRLPDVEGLGSKARGVVAHGRGGETDQRTIGDGICPIIGRAVDVAGRHEARPPEADAVGSRHVAEGRNAVGIPRTVR